MMSDPTSVGEGFSVGPSIQGGGVASPAEHSPETDALLDVVPTIRFGRQRTLHGVTVGIDGQRVYLATRCGIRTDEGEGEYTSTHGVVTCDGCTTPPGGEA